MTNEKIKRMFDACYQAKRIREMLPPLPPGVMPSYIQYLDIIEKLEKQGIILGYNTVIDRQKLGYHITAFINLELSADQKSEFYPFISSCPNVLECNCITGVYSMLIKVAFPSTQELDTFIGKIQRFGNTSTQIVFSTPVPHREIIVEPNS